MQLNIAQKIFGIALTVLLLMVAVAVFSIKFTAEISRELDLVANKQLPLSDTVGQLNVRVLEQGVLLQRLFALHHDQPETVDRVLELGDEIDGGFTRAFELLEAEKELVHDVEGVETLIKALREVEADYRIYETKGLDLLELHEGGDQIAFEALLPEFNTLQSAVDAEIQVLRRHVEDVAETAVRRADENEKLLLYLNSILTTIATVLGLAFAALVTNFLVRAVRRLVNAAEAVGAGDLEQKVPVETEDEVGKLSWQFNVMVADLRMKERIKDTFGKYMDPRLVTRLVENPELTELGGERREMTVMFIDLQGYTSISEKLPPMELIRMLNMFLGHMTEAVAANKGVINDFLGDAVMAYWGPPFTDADEHAALACKTALVAKERFQVFREEVAQALGTQVEGLDIAMRIGISTGHVISGNIGSERTRKFSVVGDPVNLGARLEGANKNYGTRVMISERTRELAGDAVEVRELDLIRVKGKAQPTRVYQLLPAPQDFSKFDQALAAYRAQDWDGAEAALNAHAALQPEDPVTAVFRNRIRQLQAQPPGADWDGVWEFQTK